MLSWAAEDRAKYIHADPLRTSQPTAMLVAVVVRDITYIRTHRDISLTLLQVFNNLKAIGQIKFVYNSLLNTSPISLTLFSHSWTVHFLEMNCQAESGRDCYQLGSAALGFPWSNTFSEYVHMLPQNFFLQTKQKSFCWCHVLSSQHTSLEMLYMCTGYWLRQP